MQPAADRDAASQGRVGIGKLIAAYLAGGIDAGAGLVDDDIRELREQGVGRVRPGRCLRRWRALRLRVSGGLADARARRVRFPPAAPARPAKAGADGCGPPAGVLPPSACSCSGAAAARLGSVVPADVLRRLAGGAARSCSAACAKPAAASVPPRGAPSSTVLAP